MNMQFALKSVQFSDEHGLIAVWPIVTTVADGYWRQVTVASDHIILIVDIP